MLYARNSVFEAVSCQINFEKHGRYVFFTFEDTMRKLIVRATEADVANITGRFLKERLFGLH